MLTEKETTAEELAEGYFYKQYSYSEICKMLSQKHNIHIPVKNLQRYFSNQGLKRKNIVETAKEQLVAAIIQEVLASGKNLKVERCLAISQ